MEISSAHHQAFASHQLEEALGGGCPKIISQHQQERKERPQPEQALKCPRCDSTNTKFCYYNNYSLSQPRYFCKGCRRYWTQGGSLRNVPVGGGCRKNKRSSSSSNLKKQQDQTLATNSNPFLPTLQSLSYDPNDLTLALARLQNKQPNHDSNYPFLVQNSNPNPNNQITTAPTGTGFLDILRSGFLDANNPCGFQNLYYGFGGSGSGSGSVEEVEGSVLPYDGGLASATTAAAEATTVDAFEGSNCKAIDEGENKVVMGNHWQLGGDHGNNLSLNSARDFWNGAAGSYWHGVINNSLM